jgi:hypothetical protein
MAVCNFSLLESDLTPLLRALRAVLRPRGHLIVQTVHPWLATGDLPYVDGMACRDFRRFRWRVRRADARWYFRTLASWIDAIGAGGFTIARCEEPVDAKTGRPAVAADRCDSAPRCRCGTLSSDLRRAHRRRESGRG